VVLRGTKHSYEIAASPVMDVAMQSVIGWLTMEEQAVC